MQSTSEAARIKENIFILGKWHYLVAVLFIVLLFQRELVSLCNTFLVNPVLSKITDSYLTDMAWYTCAIFLVVKNISRCRRFVPNLFITVSLIASSIFYLSLRFNSTVWYWTSLETLPWLYYADILLVITTAQITLHIPNKTFGFEDQLLKSTEAITDPEKDEYGFKKYAKNIADHIFKAKGEESIAFGITASWGSGKTTFLNFIKAFINDNPKKDKFIIMDFHPWRSATPQGILSGFLKQLGDEVSGYHSKAEKLIATYAKNLLDERGIDFWNTTTTILNPLVGETNQDALHSSIDDSLDKLGKRVLVFVDDLDRLTPEECFQVLRIVRNTANFKNLTFVLAYDTAIISNAIAQIIPHNAEEYLEKIVPLEFNLPKINRSDLLNYLEKELISLFPAAKVRIKEVFSHQFISKETLPIISHWIDNKRDVDRLINSFIVNANTLIAEVDFYDFIRIELLRLKFPVIYQELGKTPLKFLSVQEKGGGFKLRYSGIDPYNHLVIQKALEEFPNTYAISKENIPDILDFLHGLFPSEQGFSHNEPTHLSIRYPDHFDRYFTYDITAFDISEKRFVQILELPLDDMKAQAVSWIKEGREYQFLRRIGLIKPEHLRDKNSYENFIRWMLFVANQESKPKLYPGIDGKITTFFMAPNPIELLSNYNNKLVKRFYPEPDGLEKLKDFIKQVFYDAKSPYTLEADLIRSIVTYDSYGLPIDYKELNEIAIYLFEKYIKETPDLNRNHWSLYWSTQYFDRKPNTHYDQAHNKEQHIPERAKEIFRDFALSQPVRFVEHTIVLSSFSETEKTYRFDPAILKIFDSIDSYVEQIALYLECKYKEEFMEFYNVFSIGHLWNTSLPFNFRHFNITKVKE